MVAERRCSFIKVFAQYTTKFWPMTWINKFSIATDRNNLYFENETGVLPAV